MIFVPLTEKEAKALLHALQWADHPASVVHLEDLARIEQKLRMAVVGASKTGGTIKGGT